MRLAISALLIFIYWGFNLYFKHLFVNFASIDIVFGVIFSILILILAFINSSTNKEETSLERKKVQAFHQIADVTTSFMPIKQQLNKVTQTLNEKLGIECAFICEYDQDKRNTMLRLSSNEFLKEFEIPLTFQPHKEFLTKNSLEEFISNFYLEKRTFMHSKVTRDNQEYVLYISALMTRKNPKPFGVLVMLTKIEDDLSEYSKSIAELLSFTLSLNKKKASSEAFQNNLLATDDNLNIPTSTTLQATIEKEFNRHQRYHTNLSLIIIEIDHISNLKNIFPPEDITRVKKEFIRLVQKNLRDSDSFGKWSDDKFAIVSPNIEFRAAKSLANKLTRLFAQQRFTKIGKITCSFGLTSVAQKDNMIDFRKRAESALHSAKSKGGNAIEVKILV